MTANTRLSEKQTRTLVLGVGNPLQSDDGFGARAVELLSQRQLPNWVTVEEAGTPGLGLPNWLQNWKRVIIVDAIQMGEQPGTWRRFDADQVRLLAHGQLLSLHQSGLAAGLALADTLNVLPEEVIFYGVEPENIEWGLNLSPAVESALPGFLDELMAELVESEQ